MASDPPAAAPSPAEEQLKAAAELAAQDPAAGAAKLKSLVLDDVGNDAEGMKAKEAAIGQLCELYVKQQDAQALADLLSSLRAFFNSIPKAKTAKLVRSIIDSIAKVPGSTQLQVSCTCFSRSGAPQAALPFKVGRSHASAAVGVQVVWAWRGTNAACASVRCALAETRGPRPEGGRHGMERQGRHDAGRRSTCSMHPDECMRVRVRLGAL